METSERYLTDLHKHVTKHYPHLTAMHEHYGRVFPYWIADAVKHPGRCTPRGTAECPPGSPQYRLAERFKHGDIHADNKK